MFDGSWQKRGFTSLNGVITATSIDTGKVLDVECLSKYCFICKGKRVLDHDGCQANYKGTSGGMEVAGVERIYDRSNTQRNPLRYTKFLGDGDCKSFEHVRQKHPYGQDVEIIKQECIGHIQKRMGARLLRLKDRMKGMTLEDGKPLSGKGRLSEKVISKLQEYYGHAIRSNCSDLTSMRKAIWATFYHKMSTPENQFHGHCPEGENSWYKYNQSIALNKEPPLPTNTIPVAVMKTIKPVYKDLSEPSLLRKCLHGMTQNQNESFNNIV